MLERQLQDFASLVLHSSHNHIWPIRTDHVRTDTSHTRNLKDNSHRIHTKHPHQSHREYVNSQRSPQVDDGANILTTPSFPLKLAIAAKPPAQRLDQRIMCKKATRVLLHRSCLIVDFTRVRCLVGLIESLVFSTLFLALSIALC
jgi:hypothetical protein